MREGFKENWRESGLREEKTTLGKRCVIDEAKKKKKKERHKGEEGGRRRIGKEEHKGMREASEDRRMVFQYSPQHDP